MRLKIDNFDGVGVRDYTAALATDKKIRIIRRINRPNELELHLVSNGPNFVVPADGARLILQREDNGLSLFSGYLTSAPEFEYLGWGERGPVYRYTIRAVSDEAVLNRKTLPPRCPFVGRSAGDALRQITESIAPGAFDTSAVLEPIEHTAKHDQPRSTCGPIMSLVPSTRVT